MNPGTIRCATEARIVELAADIDGWALSPTAGSWHVQLPPSGTPQSRQWVIIGLANGSIGDGSLASGHGPSVDSWAIQCAAGITSIADPAEARQACEQAVNDLADLFAADDRLGMNPGPRDLKVANFAIYADPPSSGHPTFARAEIEITANADIWRNP